MFSQITCTRSVPGRLTRASRFILSAAFLLLLPALSFGQPDNERRQSEPFRPPQAGSNVEFVNGRKAAKGEVLLRFKDTYFAGANQQQVSSLIEDVRRSEDAELFELLSDTGVMRLRSRSKNIEAVIRQLARRGEVLYAEPNYEVHASAAVPTNDPKLGELWGLQNTGQGTTPGTPGADIKAVNA